MRFMILGEAVIDTKPGPIHSDEARTVATGADYRFARALRNLLENNAEEYDSLVKHYREEDSADF